jgi:hypothetical protein
VLSAWRGFLQRLSARWENRRVTDTADGAEPAPQRASRGVRAIASDLRVSGISLELDPNGVPSRVGGQVAVELRTDMWPPRLSGTKPNSTARDSLQGHT